MEQNEKKDGTENMEIERKFLVKRPPEDLEAFPFHLIEQAYLCTSPVVRVRRQDEDYYLTYKGHGLMARREYNLPLDKASYHHLLSKADGNIITKKRYLIPLPGGALTAELDLFGGKFAGLILAEVEFRDQEAARRFQPPDWFGEEVTFSHAYQNSTLSQMEAWP